MSDMYVGSQMPLYQNVCIRRRLKSGKILEERYAKNRVTKLMLYGIARFLLGHYNNSSPEKIYEVIPRYLALGTNIPGADVSYAGVTRQASVNDARLLNEIKMSSTSGRTEPVNRIWIAERNFSKLNTKFSDNFIKISIKTYVSSNTYDGMTIGEAGLFSKEKDNNCLARVTFDPIVKKEGEVLDIQWDITLMSYGETIYPDSITIEQGDKITLPLQFTTRHFIEKSLGLIIDPITKTIGDNIIPDYFSFYDNANYNNGDLVPTENYDTFEKIKATSWYIHMQSLDLNDEQIEKVYNTLCNSKVNDIDNPYYLLSRDEETTCLLPFYFGSLYSTNISTQTLSRYEMGMFLLYNEEKGYTYEDTGDIFKETNNSNEQMIITYEGDGKTYRIIDNEICKLNIVTNQYEGLEYYMYNGVIVNKAGEDIGYSYSMDGKFYKTTITTNDMFLNQYLTYSYTSDNKFYLYNINENSIGDILTYTGYSIDLLNDQQIYQNEEKSMFHLSNDYYWVISSDFKLIPIITPQNATDRSISWSIQNANIAKINFDGVVNSWNIGETTAIATTSNDLKAKTIIEVVRDTTFIPVESIEVNPKQIILVVDGDPNQSYDVTATINPVYASNTTISWSPSSEIMDCIKVVPITNNIVRVSLNDSGNIGTGYLRATSNGTNVYDECLVMVVSSDDVDDCDCPDPSHKYQKL